MEKLRYANVVGSNGDYQVDNFGTVKSLTKKIEDSLGRVSIRRGKKLSLSLSEKGYLRVSIIKNGVWIKTGAHRLVAEAFIPNPLNLPQVNHLDGNKTNNYVWNLQWCTNSDNQNHAVKFGLCNPNKSDKHHLSKLSNNQVKEARKIFELGGITYKSLAQKYNISISAMYNILTHKTYINI